LHQSKALEFHASEPHGKVGICVTKDVENNIGLAYSPGVAEPCLEIHKDKAMLSFYTNFKNRIAIVSNGTAVLGLGNIGAAASKPVLEGKCALFKILADIDCVDLIFSETDPEVLAKQISHVAESFAGIMIEDVKAPECFALEEMLQDRLGIPVFHDDQHGTAVVCVSAVINWLKRYPRNVTDLKVVCVGTGAAGIGCLNLLVSFGIRIENITTFDTKGVIHSNRTDINEYKRKFATNKNTTLAEALVGANIFLGTSVAGTLNRELIAKLAPNALILALANPVPEITPDIVMEERPDCLICTGRSDFPNQVNNVFCFPYLFRILLDLDLKLSNHLKLVIAKAIASLAKGESLMPNAGDVSIRYLMPAAVLRELGMNDKSVQYSRSNAIRLLPSIFELNPNQTRPIHPKEMLTMRYSLNIDGSEGVASILDDWGIVVRATPDFIHTTDIECNGCEEHGEDYLTMIYLNGNLTTMNSDRLFAGDYVGYIKQTHGKIYVNCHQGARVDHKVLFNLYITRLINASN